MKVSTTDSHELVRCFMCEKEVQQRNTIGVKVRGYPTRWTCVDCLDADDLDRTPPRDGSRIRVVIDMDDPQ